MQKRLFFALSLLVSQMSLAQDEQIFALSMSQSNWSNQSSVSACVLSQEIPDYGELRFERLAGEQVHFRVQKWDGLWAAVQGTVSLEIPDWKYTGSAQVITKVLLQAGASPLKLPTEQTLRLLQGLKSGYIPTLRYQDIGNIAQEVRVMPIGFVSAYVNYLHCSQTLLPFKLADIALTRISFADRENLSEAAMRDLQRLVIFSKSGLPYKGFILRGYSDNQNSMEQNLRLSADRVAQVKDYLIGQGLSESLLQTYALGSADPITKNDTPEEQAKNRRVTVELRR